MRSPRAVGVGDGLRSSQTAVEVWDGLETVRDGDMVAVEEGRRAAAAVIVAKSSAQGHSQTGEMYMVGEGDGV